MNETKIPELPLLEFFKIGTYYASGVVEAIAGLVIVLAILEATLSVLRLFPRRISSTAQAHQSKEEIRLSMGRWLALALEFELAADILRTAVAPSWDEIGKLAAIVVLRTTLNYFLQQEIDKAAERSNPTATSS